MSHPCLAQVLALWPRFEHTRLVDMPKLLRDVHWPIDIDTFVGSIESSCELAEETMIATFGV